MSHLPDYPTGYLCASIKSDVDEFLPQIGEVPTEDRVAIHEFIEDMFATDRPPFHPIGETCGLLPVRAVFGDISGCFWAGPEFYEVANTVYERSTTNWIPNARLKLVSTAAALALSSCHGEAIASDDQRPLDDYVSMLQVACQTQNGFACLAGLYALARLWVPPMPPFENHYVSRRTRHKLRAMTLDATCEVSHALRNSPSPDTALLDEINARLTLERHHWAHEGPISAFFRLHPDAGMR